MLEKHLEKRVSWSGAPPPPGGSDVNMSTLIELLFWIEPIYSKEFPNIRAERFRPLSPCTTNSPLHQQSRGSIQPFGPDSQITSPGFRQQHRDNSTAWVTPHHRRTPRISPHQQCEQLIPGAWCQHCLDVKSGSAYISLPQRPTHPSTNNGKFKLFIFQTLS